MEIKNMYLNLLLGMTVIIMKNIETVSCDDYGPCNPASTHQYRLYKQLFKDYNPKLRPRVYSGQSVYVGIEFELNAISSLDEVNQVMNTVGFVVANWTDAFLQWEPEHFNGTDHLVLPPSDVWLPDIAIKNSADTFYDVTFTRDFRVDVKHTGRVLWAFGGNFATSCTLDMTYYPFDLQTCEIDVENWAYTTDAVNLYNVTPGVHLQDYSTNGEWKLDHTEALLDPFEEDTHPGKTFPRVRFRFYMSRKVSYYVINIICPSLFVITISMTVFWLPPESGEKVSLGITVLLAFSVFQLVIMDNTPRTSDFTPVMTVLFTVIMGMSTFSVLTSIAVLYFHHHGAERRAPQLIRFVAYKVLARAMCMEQHVPDDNQIVPKVEGEQKMSPNDEEPPGELIEYVGGVTTFGVHTNNHRLSSTPPTSPKRSKSEREYVKEILQHIRHMAARTEKQERDNVIMEEWRAISKVMDRSFFWIAFFIMVVFLPTMLLRKDSEH